MNTILFNEHSGLIRSGWRAAIFVFVYFFAALFFGSIGTGISIGLRSAGLASQSAYFVTNALFSLIPAILVGWLCGRFLEKLPYRAFGAAFTRNWLRHFAIGLIVGALALTIAVVPGFAFGSFRFVMNDVGFQKIAVSGAVSFAVFAVAAAFEEALFRGYLLQTFARSNLAWLAILLTSVFFGAMHLGNPNATFISTANTILAGIWFSIAYLKTRDLWFVWGLHLMWNWMQGSFFGIEVSGLTEIAANPVFKEIDFGPTWLTGETYGIEGGVLCTFAIMVAIAAVYFLPGVKADDELLAMNSPKPELP